MFYRQTSPTYCEEDIINVAPTSTAVMLMSSSTELMGGGEATGISSTAALVFGPSSSNSAELYTTLGTRLTTFSISNTEQTTTSTPVPTVFSVADTSNFCEKCLNSTSDLCEKCLNSTRGGGSQSVIIVPCW